MKPSSLIDQIVTGLYWPSFLFALLVIISTPIFVFSDLISPVNLALMTKVLAGFCVILFVLMLLDKETQIAVTQFNERSRLTWKSMTWRQRIFQRVGDGRMQFCLWVLWVEMIVLFFDQTGVLTLWVFAGFFQTVLMLILTLKRHSFEIT